MREIKIDLFIIIAVIWGLIGVYQGWISIPLLIFILAVKYCSVVLKWEF